MAEAARVGERAWRREAPIVLAGAAGLALAVALGLWQLDRAAQKTALQAALEARANAPALDAGRLARDPAAVEAQHFRRARITGRWDSAHTVYLDNRPMDGRVGFFVLTPLKLDGSNEAVLVQRGFAPRRFDDRAALPNLSADAGTVVVEGVVTPSPSRLYEFAAAASGPIRQNVDVPSFARETGLVLLPLTLRESATPANAGDGLARHWPAPAAGLQKHYGYAFQWFAIGAVILFLYVRHRVLRHRQRARHLG